MTWASLALVIVLGSATLLTHDPRFVLAKPAIGHFAIGAIMLKRGWMLRYLPPIVTETIPEYVTFAGYAWAALMFRARRRHHRRGDDRRHEAVDVLCHRRAGRRQDCGLRHPIRRVSCFGRQPASAPPPTRLRHTRQRTLETVGLVRRDRLYRRIKFGGISRTIPVCWEICRGDKNGRGRKLEYRHEHADGRAQGDADPAEATGGTLTGTQGADGNSARNLRRHHQRRRPSPGRSRSPTRCR